MSIQTVTPHLVIRGAAAAIDFYKNAFGAVEHHRMPSPDGAKLWHAELGFGPLKILLADDFPEMGGSPPPTVLGGTSVVIHLGVDNCDETFERAVAAGATVISPPMDMFWGDRYAQVVDPYGHKWSIAQTLETLSPDQMSQRAAQWAAQNGF